MTSWRKTVGGNEARAADVLEAFGGRGMVRLHDREAGAILIERLDPATRLSALALKGEDDEATRILGCTIAAMTADRVPHGLPTVADWAVAFDRLIESGTALVPDDLVRDARRVYLNLCGSQSQVRLLHGDLHHDNVLFDSQRGWLAIDPKGVNGELEYEVGAALRNPIAAPELFCDPATFDRRVACFARELPVERDRVVGWAFAQAVLAAIWTIEDGEGDRPRAAWIALAEMIRPQVRYR